MLVRPVARTLALFVLWLFGCVTVALGQTPDFTGISAADRQAMERVCRGELLVSGPAANLYCLSNQIKQVRQLAVAITQPPNGGVDLFLTTRTEVVPEETTIARQPTALVPEENTELSSSIPLPFGLPTGSAVPQAAEPLPAAIRRPAASDDNSGIWVVLTVAVLALVWFLVASKAKPCSNCSVSTSDPSGVCDSCRAERDRRQRAEADGEERRKEETSQKQQAEERRRHDEEARRTFDPYVVLGVPRLASQDEIKRAYRDMMTKYHPDKVSAFGRRVPRDGERESRGYQPSLRDAKELAACGRTAFLQPWQNV